jgi:hypothetical protein
MLLALLTLLAPLAPARAKAPVTLQHSSPAVAAVDTMVLGRSLTSQAGWKDPAKGRP